MTVAMVIGDVILQALASGPGALFVSSDTVSSVRDLEVKIREDPLFLIKYE